MAVINKERASGMYRLSAYILSKFTSELPLTILLPCVCQPIVYWMAGLNPDIGIFFASVGVCIADALLGQSAGFLIGAVFSRFDLALTATTLYIISSLLLGGFYTRHLPSWLSWIQYTSIILYPYRALVYFEFSNNLPIKCVMGERSIFTECAQQMNITFLNETIHVPSNAVLELEGIKAPLYCYLLSIVVVITSYRMLVYIAFVIVRKPK